MQPIKRPRPAVSAARSAPGRLSAIAIVATASLLSISASAFAAVPPPTQGIRAFRLCTGPDHLSHVVRGTIDQNAVIDVSGLNFKESPAHATYDWHAAPEAQYVITLSGTLEFSTTGGENFVLHPGEVLLAQDTTGPGHRWKLIDDQPWRRAYVILKAADDVKGFVPNAESAHQDGCPD